MNKLGKTLFTLSSLAPLFLVLSIRSLFTSEWKEFAIFVSISAILISIVVWVYFVVTRKHQPFDIKTKKVKSVDKESMAFLLTYLLPLYAKDTFDFKGDLAVAVSVFIIILVAIYFSTAFTYNPILALWGYHFYEVESNDMTYIIITKQTLNQPVNELTIRLLHDSIYLHTPEKDE